MRTLFEWDASKAMLNIEKHNVPFETAARAFSDPFSMTEQDRIEGGKRRWKTIGFTENQLLHIAHTVTEKDNGDEIVRIISARRATRRERRRYEDTDRPL